MRAEEGHARWASSLGRPSRLSPLLETKGRELRRRADPPVGRGRGGGLSGRVALGPHQEKAARGSAPVNPAQRPRRSRPLHAGGDILQHAAAGWGGRRWEDDVP